MLKETVLLEGCCCHHFRPTGRNVLPPPAAAPKPPVQRGTANNPVRRRGRVAPGRKSLEGFHVSISFCSRVWRPWLLPLHYECDAAADFIFRKNLAGFFHTHPIGLSVKAQKKVVGMVL